MERNRWGSVVERFFFYGTLRRGETTCDEFCRGATSLEPAVASGSLFALPAGYPVLLLTPEESIPPARHGPGAVLGEVVCFPDPEERVLRLDAYEGVLESADAEYVRAVVPVRLLRTGDVVNAWAYVCPPSKKDSLIRVGRILPTGDWRNR